MDPNSSGKRTSPLLIAAAWLLVILPAGWGLRYTVGNALKLFTKGDAAISAQPSPATH